VYLGSRETWIQTKKRGEPTALNEMWPETRKWCVQENIQLQTQGRRMRRTAIARPLGSQMDAQSLGQRMMGKNLQ
jgi:hypothetical protein